MIPVIEGLAARVSVPLSVDTYKATTAAAALAVRVLTAWAYAVRALAALVIPGRDASIYWAHARQALCPARGESLRDRVAQRSVSSSAASAS